MRYRLFRDGKHIHTGVVDQKKFYINPRCGGYTNGTLDTNVQFMDIIYVNDLYLRVFDVSRGMIQYHVIDPTSLSVKGLYELAVAAERHVAEYGED